jgi:hypothetical protein
MTTRWVAAGVAATVLAATLGLSAGPAAGGPATERQTDRCDQPGPYDLPQGGERVDLRAKHFTTRIDHPYWPMRPGTTWHYVERGGGEVAKVRVRVTHRTKLIAGIKARVVRDVVSVDGEVVEDTRDWYAQDTGGNLWYLGENTQEYEDGEVVSTEGSWQHGRDGGQAGVILPARPRAGCRYREEFLAGEAEDRAEVLSTRESLRTPTGFHEHVVHTANTTPLEPAILENKFYARGVGPVLELDLSPEFGRAVLVRVRHAD